MPCSRSHLLLPQALPSGCSLRNICASSQLRRVDFTKDSVGPASELLPSMNRINPSGSRTSYGHTNKTQPSWTSVITPPEGAPPFKYYTPQVHMNITLRELQRSSECGDRSRRHLKLWLRVAGLPIIAETYTISRSDLVSRIGG